MLIRANFNEVTRHWPIYGDNFLHTLVVIKMRLKKKVITLVRATMRLIKVKQEVATASSNS